jgi:hypothetical protein
MSSNGLDSEKHKMARITQTARKQPRPTHYPTTKKIAKSTCCLLGMQPNSMSHAQYVWNHSRVFGISKHNSRSGWIPSKSAINTTMPAATKKRLLVEEWRSGMEGGTRIGRHLSQCLESESMPTLFRRIWHRWLAWFPVCIIARRSVACAP